MKQKYVLRKIGKHLCNVVLVAGTSAQLLAPLVHADEVPASPATEVGQNAPVASPEVATPTTATPTSETQRPRPAETFVTMTMIDNKGAFVQPKVRWTSPLDVETTYPLGSQVLVDETYYEVVVVHAESIVTPRPDMDRDLREIAYTVEVKPVRTVRFGYELNTIYRYKDKQVKFEKVINVYDTRQTRNGVLTMAIYNFRNNTTDVVAQNVHYKVKSIREEAGDKEIRHGESIQVVNLIVELDLANPVILNQDEAPTPDLQEKPEAEAPTSETGGSEELPAPDENVPTSETPTSETPISETPTSEEVVPNKDNENPVVPSDTKHEPALVTTETPTTVSETPKDATGPGTSQDEPSADVSGKDQPVIENNANHLVGGGQTTEKPKEEASDKERLPETGTESVIGTLIAGIGSILGSIGLVARKKQ